MADCKQLTAERIKVMQSYLDGEQIEMFNLLTNSGWSITPWPNWDWASFRYRVVIDDPDSIDWNAIHKEFKWMARDRFGSVTVFTERPVIQQNAWSLPFTDLNPWRQPYSVDHLSSLKVGNKKWDKSLVQRPGDCI